MVCTTCWLTDILRICGAAIFAVHLCNHSYKIFLHHENLKKKKKKRRRAGGDYGKRSKTHDKRASKENIKTLGDTMFGADTGHSRSSKIHGLCTLKRKRNNGCIRAAASFRAVGLGFADGHIVLYISNRGLRD
jgi:hypothetical protein